MCLPLSFPRLVLFTQSCITVTPGEPTLRVNGKDVIPAGTSGSSSTLAPIPSNTTALAGPTGHVGQLPSSKRDIIQVGPFSEGSTIVLECAVSGGRPLPEVRWFNSSRPLRSKISVSHDPEKGSTITSIARFIVTRYDLASVFSCRVSNNATLRPFVKWLSLDVHGADRAIWPAYCHPPSSFSSSCPADDDELLLILTLIMDPRFGSLLDWLLSLLYVTEAVTQNWYFITLLILSCRSSCVTDVLLPCSRDRLPSLLLVVFLNRNRNDAVKPLSLRVRGPMAPVVAGEMVSLTCSVDGARPRATIDWFNRSDLVDPQPASRDDPMSDTTFR